jgi:hypothetical protein
VDEPTSTQTSSLLPQEPYLRIVVLDLEAIGINEALNFRALVLQNCTLYAKKKTRASNEALISFPRSPDDNDDNDDNNKIIPIVLPSAGPQAARLHYQAKQYSG